MVDSVGSSTAAAGGFAQALGASKGMGREAFLKLLVAQLKNQDPLKPQDNSAFVAELAQFSSLEQTMGINDRLDLLSAKPLRNGAVAMHYRRAR
jgi:flagellar basal-body rod modification protein FlgD